MEISSEDKSKIIGILSVLFPKASIYLFGSRARGTHSPMSDIDLAIDEGSIMEPRRIGEARSMLNESSILLKIDVVDFQEMPQYLQNIIKKEGILWKQ